MQDLIETGNWTLEEQHPMTDPLRTALETAARTFEDYAEQHRRKNTGEGDSKAAKNTSMARMCRGALAATPAVEGPKYQGLLRGDPLFAPTQAPQPVAWRVKDFADGWILCRTEGYARHLAEGAGNLVQPLYAGPQPPPPGSVEVLDPKLDGALRILLQLALDEILNVVEAVDHQHNARAGHMKYVTPWAAITGARKLREDLLAQAAMWGILLSPRREPADALSRLTQADDGWRDDMETAPRDGTHILLAFGQDHVAEGWCEDDDAQPRPWAFVDCGCPGSTFGGAEALNRSRDGVCGPTHWRPLPSPPSSTERA